MNKSDNTKIQKIIGDYINKFEPIKIIYTVNYKEVHNMPELKITKNHTYNLFAFEDFNEAKEYMNTAYEAIINPLITSGNFRIILETNENELESESDYNKLLHKRTVRLIGNKDLNKSQTRLFIFTIETINFRPMCK